MEIEESATREGVEAAVVRNGARFWYDPSYDLHGCGRHCPKYEFYAARRRSAQRL